LRFHPLEHQRAAWLDWRDEIAESSLIILQDLNSLQEYPFKFLSEDLKPPSLLFPSLAFAPLWPFSTEFSGRDEVAEKLCAARNRSGLVYFDYLLGSLRCVTDKNVRYSSYRYLRDEEGSDVEKRIRIRNFERILDLECSRLIKLDANYGLSIGRYIIDNFRDQRLFHTIGHPTVELVHVLVTQLMEKVGVSSSLSRPLIDSLAYYQLPVHPVVAETLRVNWVTPDMTYIVLGENLTFEGYTRRYIDEFG
jgi:hypothetical protein